MDLAVLLPFPDWLTGKLTLKIIKKKVRLEEFLVQAITRGSDDLGKVHVQISYKGNIYYGFGGSTDIITASVEAFIDAISNIINL